MLGRKLDSIPFSPYHLMVIGVLGLVGFIDGYDLVMTGSLLVLAKQPLHLTPGEIRFLAIASTLMICVGGFIASTISDHFSRKTIMLIGVGAITFFTLLIPLVQNAEQLIALRLLTGLGGGFAVSAPFPIAAELMPAQHRRTFGAVYEMALAASFTVLPFVGFLLRRQSECLPDDGTARRTRVFCRAGVDLFFDPGKPALVSAPRPDRGGGRHRQPDHSPGRQPGAGTRPPQPSATMSRVCANSFRPIGRCSVAANCAGRRSAFPATSFAARRFF